MLRRNRFPLALLRRNAQTAIEQLCLRTLPSWTLPRLDFGGTKSSAVFCALYRYRAREVSYRRITNSQCFGDLVCRTTRAVRR
jgi:hypothetical protein